MCIAIHKPEGKNIKEEILRECFFNHEDGAGFCFIGDGKINVMKGYMKAQDLIDAIKPHMDKDLLIHFRSASPGMKIDRENCHPFHFTTHVKDGVAGFHWAVIHNGKLTWPNTPTESDTNCFVNDILKVYFERDPWMIDCDIGVTFLYRFINYNVIKPNKMVIMRYEVAKDEYVVQIINQQAGEVHDDVWYSNGDWRPIPPIANYKKWQQHLNLNAGATAESTRANYDINEFHTPDADGWYWDPHEDMFVNSQCEMVFELPNRARPYLSTEYHPRNRVRFSNYLAESTSGSKFLLGTITNPMKRALSNPGINVPRDAELAPKHDGLDPKDFDSFEHLEKEDERRLVHEAVAMMRRHKTWPAREIQRMNSYDKIRLLRVSVRALFAVTEQLDLMFLDLWILDKIKSGSFRKEMVDRENAELKNERDSERAAAGYPY